MEGRLGQLLLRQFYKPFDDKVVEVLKELLAGWGRKMKPPMDVRSFSTLLNAVAEGLALRARGSSFGCLFVRRFSRWGCMFCLLSAVVQWG